MATSQPVKCIICQKSGGSDLRTVPDRENLEKLKDFAIKRSLYGESKFAPFCDRIMTMPATDYLKSSYHSSCYKDIVHTAKLKRAVARYNEAASTSKAVLPPKRGRPSSATRSGNPKEGEVRPRRSVEKTRLPRCVFQCETPESGDLHRVMSTTMGEKFMFIKENTLDDHLKVALASVNEPLDCTAQDMFYHRNCLRQQERKIYQQQSDVTSPSTDSAKYIADIDIVNAIKCSLRDGSVITLTDVEKNYREMLSDNGIELGTGSQKKYLKKLISDNIDDVEFVQSHRRNESLQIVSKKLLGETISDLRETIEDEQEDVRCLSKAASIIRRELLGIEPWKFTGTLTGFQTPTKLATFLKWVLIGTKNTSVTERYDEHVQKSVSLISQHTITNLKTDRQARYKAKSDSHVMSKTPLSIGLALAVHKRTRSKNLVNVLSNLQLGANYKQTVNLEKRIACGVAERMKTTGGFCLPPFVKKDKSIFFAADNIDFLEDTADGQNTLHGTLLVINQGTEGGALPVNEPLEIPNEVCIHADVEPNYLKAPEIRLKAMRFETFDFQPNKELLKKYELHDLTWFFACYAHRESTLGDSNSVLEPEDGMDLQETQDCESEPCKDDYNVCPTDEDTSQFESAKTSEHKPGKTDLMPTWGATNSLLIQSTTNHSSRTVNTGIVAPLLRRPPTDYGVLYTVLCLAQGISAVVVGPNRKTIITLDLDLYERGLKIQSSTGNSNWFLRAGELHICFASLHALGKYIEGSGLDSVSSETGLYSPTTIHQIFSGKSYKRGIEYHITNVLACYELMFDTLNRGTMENVLTKCQEFRQKLHDRQPDATDLMEEICLALSEQQVNLDQNPGEMAQFLRNYMKQVVSLLRLIRGSRQCEFELYLGALEEQVKYYFAHDLYKYARLIPVHLAQTYELKTTDPETWDALKKGDFVVSKSGVPFTDLFVDQTLEQKIRELKVAGGITGITQHEDALNRYLLIAPELTRLVKEFQEIYGIGSSSSSDAEEHYQLAGTVAIRIFKNAGKVKECILKHCQENPFIAQIKLMNIVSNMALPDEAKRDILLRDEKGEARFREFVSTRMLTATANKSIWDPVVKMKLKGFTTMQRKTTCKGTDKLVKLREDRQLLARFLVVQQSRPEFGDTLGETIGTFEFSVIPKSLFSPDGQLLIPTDKSSFMKLIENYVPQEGVTFREDRTPCEKRAQVCIIDAMAIVQGIKKGPQMETCADFADTFVQCINRIMQDYSEGRVIFDRYVQDSLKAQTRSKRSAGTDPVKFAIHDRTNIKLVKLKTLLSHVETKADLTEYLGKALLHAFSKKDKNLVVVYGTSAFGNKPNLLDPVISQHSHEEADTLIPLHVLDAAQKNEEVRDIDVYSPDTDVFLLLMDLVAVHQLQAELNFVTGTGKCIRKIDVHERCSAITNSKARGLVGLHAFSGADWGGKFAGVSKKRWLECYLSLETDNEIVAAFHRLGKAEFNLSRDLTILENFTCAVYSRSDQQRKLSDLRWELFRTKNLENEKLPPTLATFEPHVRRAHVIATISRSYEKPMPQIPPLVGNGWEESEDGSIVPIRCLKLPAPQAIVELVKCGCRGQCSSRCSCIKNKLNCTYLCKCNDCSNTKDYTLSFVDDDDIDLE